MDGHYVRLIREPLEWFGDEIVLVVTEGKSYPTAKVDADIATLRANGKRFGVIHNNDNPGVPTPGDYPSFCWTELAHARLFDYRPTTVRQPVLPFIMEPKARPLHIGTFGHIERKKATLDMARWAKRNSLPFTAFVPDVLTTQYRLYIDAVRSAGANVVVYPWAERIEDLAPLFTDISHFLFVLPLSKGSSGGSPTSPRFATAFARPVIVVDDERLLAQDGVYVFASLAAIQGLEQMRLPDTSWGPEQYINELVRRIA
jgi:hypothetical protein